MSDFTQSHDAQSCEAQAVRKDIAFMRNLAQDGAASPLFGGSMLAAAGLIYASACLANWVVLARMPDAAGPLTWPIWGGAMAIHAVVSTVIILRHKERGFGLSTANRANRVFGRTWNAVGFAILSCIASFTLAILVAHTPGAFAGYPAVIMALYGVGWSVTAAVSEERWARIVALACFAFAIASGALANNVNLLLLFVPALLLLLTVPGVLLIRKARGRS